VRAIYLCYRIESHHKHLLAADATASGIEPEEIRHEHDRTAPREIRDLLLKHGDLTSTPSTAQL